MQFKISQLQLAIFLSTSDRNSGLKIATIATTTIPGGSDVNPIVIPLDDNAPLEIPQVQVHNMATGWAFQFAPARIDIAFSPQSIFESQRLAEVTEEMITVAASIWDKLQMEVGAKGFRLGYVVTFDAPVKDATQFLLSHYYNIKYGQDAKEAQIHYLQTQEIASNECNIWTRVLSLPEAAGGSEAILVIIDINSSQEHKIAITSALLRDFLKASAQNMLKMIALHEEE